MPSNKVHPAAIIFKEMWHAMAALNSALGGATV